MPRTRKPGPGSLTPDVAQERLRKKLTSVKGVIESPGFARLMRRLPGTFAADIALGDGGDGTIDGWVRVKLPPRVSFKTLVLSIHQECRLHIMPGRKITLIWDPRLKRKVYNRKGQWWFQEAIRFERPDDPSPEIKHFRGMDQVSTHWRRANPTGVAIIAVTTLYVYKRWVAKFPTTQAREFIIFYHWTPWGNRPRSR